MNSFRQRVCFVGLFLCYVFCGSFSSNDLNAQTGVKKIDGHADTYSWALHESGRIFAAVTSTNTVIEYDTNGDEVRQYKVGAEPKAMIVKGDHLIVACQKTASISVIDLKANKVAGEVRLSGKGPYRLFCSKVNNGLVYGICRPHSNSTIVYQVDIAQMKVINKVPANYRWGSGNPTNITMSADGKWIVLDARNRTSPSGADLLKVDESNFTFEHVAGHHDSFGQIKAGPSNRFWTLGNELYPLNIKTSARSFGASPVAIHPEYDLAISFNGTSVNFETFSGARTLKKLTENFFEKGDRFGRRSKSNPEVFKSFNVLVGFDLQGSQAVFAAGRFCRIFDLKDLGIPLRRHLLMNVALRADGKVDEEFKIPIGLANKKLESRVSYELKSGPTDAKIVGNNLVWTPTAKSVGTHSVLVAAKVDDLLDEVSIDLNVKASKMELDFKVTSMKVDRQGKYAIAWGPKLSKKQNPNSGPDEVAVIDLESQTVVIQKPFAAGVKSAIIQYPHAFLVPKSGNVLFRIDAKTLGDSKRMFLQKNSRWIVAYMNKQIAVVSEEHGSVTLNLVDPEMMKSNGTINSGYDPHRRSGTGLPTIAAPGLIQLGSNLHNMDDGTIVSLRSNPGFKSLVSGKRESNRAAAEMAYKLRDYPPKNFGRHLTHNSIVSATGSVISLTQFRRLFSSPHHCVAFGIRKGTKPNGRVNQNETYLEIVSLVDGEVLDSQVFDVASDRRSGSSFYTNVFNSRAFFPFKDKVVYVRGSELFVVPLDQSILESAPKPLHFPIVDIPILDINKAQTISFKAVGGKGSLSYQLINEYEGIKVDPASGTVELDTPLLWKSYLKTKSGGGEGRGSHFDQLERWRSSKGNKGPTVSAKQFEEWFGEPLGEDKLSFVVPIQMAVTDEEAQEDRISVYAVVRADKGEIDKIEAKQRADQELARKEREVKRAAAKEAQRLAQAKKKEQNGVPNEGLDARMDGVEKRMRRMEATLDAILGKLEKLEGGK